MPWFQLIILCLRSHDLINEQDMDSFTSMILPDCYVMFISGKDPDLVYYVIEFSNPSF